MAGLPAAWLLVEWFRGWFLTGFPWLSLGYSQTGTWMAGIAPVLGVYGVSALLLLGAGALVTLVLGTRRERVLAVGRAGADLGRAGVAARRPLDAARRSGDQRGHRAGRHSAG